MNPADEIVPKRAKRQLDDGAAGPFDSLKEQLRAIVERPSRQSKPVEDLHGFDDRLDEPLRTTLKDFQRPSPWRKPEEENELVEGQDLRLGITSYPDHEVSERQANYDLSIENKKSRRSSRGFARRPARDDVPHFVGDVSSRETVNADRICRGYRTTT
jgi:hypothetical protein